MTTVDEEHLGRVWSFLTDSHTRSDGGFTCKVANPFEITPEEFLQYSESDLQSDLPHRYVNALSNAKRAMDCQIECILHCLGLADIAHKERWGFPRKLEILEQVGLVVPRILNRINHMRNVLEHEFQHPTQEAVIDALDVASIFVAYTNSFLVRIPTRVDLVDSTEDAECDRLLNELVRRGSDDPTFPRRPSGSVKIRDALVTICFDLDSKTITVTSAFGDAEYETTVPCDDANYLRLFRALVHFRI